MRLGVYNTPYVDDIDEAFSLAYQANSLIKVLNYKMDKAGLAVPIRIGFGMAYGRALMIKAGYKGSGIADVVYLGDVVNEAAKLASEAGKPGRDPIFVDGDIYNNFNDHNKGLLKRYGYTNVYTGYVISVGMEEWYKENCK